MKNVSLFLAFLLLGTMIIPGIYAENESVVSELNVSGSQIQDTENYPGTYAENGSTILELNVSDSQSQDTENYPMVSFDGLSDVKISENKLLGYKKNDLRIPSSIKKFELLTIDIQNMKEKLANNEPITILMKGVPYKMNLRDSTGKAEGLDPSIRSYRGTLENSENSEVGFTIGKKSVSGRITSKGITFFLSTTPKTEKGKVIHYVYSSLDVVSEGQPAIWNDDYLGKKDIQALSPVNRAFIESNERILEQQTAISGPVDVRILIMTDDKWIADVRQNESREWTDAAQIIIDEANTQLGKSDIQVNLIPIYDASKASELSADPQINHTPLQTFIIHVSPDYLNSSSADLAFYLSGYDCVDGTCGLGATYGFDSLNGTLRRYGYSQMADDPSAYDGTDHDRTVVTLHEIGHLFDADHQDATGQDQDYNRAINYTDEYGNATQTVVWQPALSSTSYDYSSINNHGGPHNDNARRINETKGVVANYYPDIPAANFTANPTAGLAPLTVQFTDTSTNLPDSWSWNFGDDDFSAWSLMNASPGWVGRYYHSSVVTHDGSIILMGGHRGVVGMNMVFLNDVWRSTDNGATWMLMNADAGWADRFGHTSVVMSDDSIVIMGGSSYSNIGSFLNDTWRSTDYGATWTLMNASSGWYPRRHFSSVAMPDDSIVLFSKTGKGSDVWRSTDYGATWTLLAKTVGWRWRQGYSSVLMPDESIVIMGGYDGSGGFLNDTWRSTDNGVTWTMINANAKWKARMDHSSVVLPDGSIILMGGYNFDDGYFNDIWRSMDNGATWTLVKPSGTNVNPGPGWGIRSGHTSVVMPDGSIVLMGGDSGVLFDSDLKNDVWSFSPSGSLTQSPSHTYTTPGIYTVSLTATNPNGGNTIKKLDYINVS
jgi:hypothetical protein